MKGLYKSTIIIAAGIAAISVMTSCDGDRTSENEVPTTRRERQYIKEGNKHFERQEYAQAEVANRKAIAENPSSDVARYNLASSLARQGSESARTEADSLFRDIAKSALIPDASQRSFYNLGNRAYQEEDYAGSIEMYKDALRRNPLDNNARENLRLAQLKLQEQQQNQDQDKNQDKQDKEEQEQDKQQQQQQNQPDQDHQDKDQQDQQDQQNQDQQGNRRPDQDKRDQQQQQGGMSQANAEQILKAMEKEENATRRRVEAQQKAERENKSTRRTVDKPW